jgi:copper chaperone
MAPEYEYNVEMTCGGCSAALNRILDRHRTDIEEHKVSLESQKVWVKSSKLDSSAIQAILEKSGKKVTFVGQQN